ncbi:DNA-binding transcriptional regulator, GntR family [Parapedobacter composti]|uniref:DNA-binding transcriptional regulator, GntR family n=1 Tax=Parapedobacter composti TaxID=623281 RepID=A0A1I1E1X7_9SPHI|nr:GntR family transcriptional regulator [Parapedobacter composti]SFB81181.1 DNA-binding transcriptional regulator, GntR family [Parapedobacter composti]
MKPVSMFEYIHINEYSATPKYLQLANAVIGAIEAGKIQKGDMMPSINELSYVLEISRDTAEKGYKHLKQLGVLGSVPGKGYYITNADFKQKLQIVLFFNKLSAHKKIVYDSFVEAIGSDVAVDFYIYNNDLSLFKKLFQNLKQEYTHYVIIPHFIEGQDKAAELINTIPKDKLVLLDKLVPGIDGEYAAVYEDFERDIYEALEGAREQLSKYHTLKLVFPDKSYFPKGIIKGFYRFCQQYAFNHLLVGDVMEEPIAEGEAYINLMEDDLVKLLDRVISLKLSIGSQVGIISYNETPLKKFILNGITTISTDFQRMGALAAQLILDNAKRHEKLPFYLTLRPSV